MDDRKLYDFTVEELERMIQNIVERSIAKIETEKPKSEKSLISTKEAMKLFDTDRKTLYNWRRQGLLPYRKMGKKIYMKAIDIDKVMKETMSNFN